MSKLNSEVLEQINDIVKNAITKNNIADAVSEKVIGGVTNDVMSVFGYEMSTRTVYIILGVLLLLVLYYFWKRYSNEDDELELEEGDN